MQSRYQFIAAGLVVAMLAACSSDPDIEPIDPDGQAAQQLDDAPEEPDDVPEEPEEPEIFQGQLYPPLPDAEPNLTSADEDLQRFYLDLHAEAYDVIETAFATADPDGLDAVLGGDELEGVTGIIEEDAEAGVVSLGPDSEVLWVELIAVDEDRGVVAECYLVGPESGRYDAETGEPVDLEETEPFAFIVVSTYERLGEGEDSFRQIEATRDDNAEVCSAA